MMEIYSRIQLIFSEQLFYVMQNLGDSKSPCCDKGNCLVKRSKNCLVKTSMQIILSNDYRLGELV